MNEMTQEFLMERFDYRDGHLYYKYAPSNRVHIGDQAGNLKSDKYMRITIDWKEYPEHTLIWIYFKGVKAKQLDHINRNKSDNHIENLREATNAQNCANSKRKKGGSGRFKGVGLKDDALRTKQWQAQITVDGHKKHLGHFTTEEEAGRVYDKAAKELFGEFAYTNEDAGLFEEARDKQ